MPKKAAASQENRMPIRPDRPFPRHIDPFDTEAFNQAYRTQLGQGRHASAPSHASSTASSPVESPVGSPELQGLKELQSRRKPARAAGKPARAGGLLQKFRSLGLCSAGDSQVDTQCVRPKHAAGRPPSGRNAASVRDRVVSRMDRMEHVPDEPDHGVFGSGADHYAIQHHGDDFSWNAQPASPGTSREFENMANDPHAVGLFGPMGWHPSMGAAELVQGPPLSPSPWETAFQAWDAADAAAAAAAHAAGPSGVHGDAAMAGPWGEVADIHGAGVGFPDLGGMDFRQQLDLMEQQHADLFSSPAIKAVRGQRAIRPPVHSTKGVELRECIVVNTARGGHDSIGTMGIATCFAMCARGRNRAGETILGLLHFTGEAPGNRIVPPGEALHELRANMLEAGAEDLSMYVVGGMASADPYLSTLHQEQEMLALRHAFNIQGARLHVNEADEMGEESYVNVLMTRDRVYFSENTLYESDDE